MKADEVMIGRKIGRYTIKDVIGSGGMGTVFLAVQEQPRRRVAVKMMKQGISSRSAQRRFEFESQLLARLKHPGIAQVYEAGTHDGGYGERPYFVMEYITNAKTLTEYAESKKLGTRERLDLFAQVCDAVQHGHLKGIVHRDLKPGNILVGSAGRPRVIDFGVARSTDSDMALTTLQTDVGQLVGTIQYMSPEQVDADPSDIDARSDVYALGVILYELLTGRLPYDVSNAAIHEAARMVREESPTRISTIDRHLKGDVETITMKAMEKIRNHRYQSATELQQDIHQYLADRPISASPPSALDNLRRFSRRHRAASVAILSVFVILVGALIGISIFAVDADRQRDIARQAQARAESVSDFVSTMLSSRDPVTMGNLDKALMKPVLAQATESMQRKFQDDPIVKADLHRVIGKAYRQLGLYKDSLIHLEQALEGRLAELGPDHPDTLDSMLDMAMQRSSERKPKDAAPYLEQVVKGRLAILGADHADTVDATLRYANCLSSLSQFDKSHELMATVLSHRKSRLGDNHIDTLDAMSSYGALLLNESRYDESAVISDDVVKRMRSSLGSSDARTLTALNNHAVILSILERREEARPLFEEAIIGRRRVIGEDHPETVRSMNHLADLLLIQKDYQKAEEIYREALDSRRRVLGNEHPDTIWSLNYLGQMLKQVGRYEEAEPYLREAMQTRRRVQGKLHLRAMESTITYAQLMLVMKEYDEALGYYREAEKSHVQAYGEDAEATRHLQKMIQNVIRIKESRDSSDEAMLSDSDPDDPSGQ